MLRTVVRSKSLWTLVLAVAVAGAAYAGGADCHGKGAAAAAGDKGAHCKLMKHVTKTAKLTEDGAIVTLEGKNDEAVQQIKSHLENHGKEEPCPGCPMSMEGVTSEVKLTDKGGEITFTGSNVDTVKAVQEWAKKPAGACCAGHDHSQKASL